MDSVALAVFACVLSYTKRSETAPNKATASFAWYSPGIYHAGRGASVGLLDRLFGEKIANENKSKPFYDNKSDAERKDWFARTRPWHKIDEKVIDALCCR